MFHMYITYVRDSIWETRAHTYGIPFRCTIYVAFICTLGFCHYMYLSGVWALSGKVCTTLCWYTWVFLESCRDIMFKSVIRSITAGTTPIRLRYTWCTEYASACVNILHAVQPHNVILARMYNNVPTITSTYLCMDKHIKDPCKFNSQNAEKQTRRYTMHSLKTMITPFQTKLKK